MTESVVTARSLVRRYGDTVALDGLDLEVRRGECLGLLGPNGAGKSTTLRILSTLLAPTSGEVRVLGLDPVREGDRLRARIGVVPQELAVYERLSARENLRFFADLYGDAADRREEVERLLEWTGLADRADELERIRGEMASAAPLAERTLPTLEGLELTRLSVLLESHLYTIVAAALCAATMLVPQVLED